MGGYRWVCVCVSMCKLSNTNIHTCTFTLSAAQMHRHVEWTCNTHFTAPHTPFTCFCFIMIFMPHRWLMTVLCWAFLLIFECLSLHPKPNQTKTILWILDNKKSGRIFNGDILQSYLEVIYFHNSCGKWVSKQNKRYHPVKHLKVQYVRFFVTHLEINKNYQQSVNFKWHLTKK